MATRAVDPELGDLAQLSRVELEPCLVDLTLAGEQARADAIRSELAARPWQGTNPYG